MCLKIPVALHSAFTYYYLFHFSLSAGHVAVSHYGFNLHFPEDYWEWALFHMFMYYFFYINTSMKVVLRNCCLVINISVQPSGSAYIQIISQKQAGERRLTVVWTISHFFFSASLPVFSSFPAGKKSCRWYTGSFFFFFF